jgi:hypothetical protein
VDVVHEAASCGWVGWRGVGEVVRFGSFDVACLRLVAMVFF